jgi:hypothetical protein
MEFVDGQSHVELAMAMDFFVDGHTSLAVNSLWKSMDRQRVVFTMEFVNGQTTSCQWIIAFTMHAWPWTWIMDHGRVPLPLPQPLPADAASILRIIHRITNRVLHCIRLFQSNY